MRSVELDLARTVRAPIDQVFARLADIEGHNDWMGAKGSLLKRTRQTSPGEASVGTTYVDETRTGRIEGEIVELEAPRRIVYHWWDRSRSGRLRLEGWPGYELQSVGDDQTLVRHHARLDAYGAYALATPILKRMARRERTVTIDSLRASFEG